jgi:large subunit ribosomal protein L19
MDTSFMQKVEKDFVKRDPDIRPGDTVNVHLRITEAGKERVQQFEGVVIGVKGSGLSKMVTVRKISNGVGVEKILPVNSPMIKKIDVKSRGNVRRSKLYYMREKIGKRSLDVTLDEHFEEVLEEDEAGTKDKKEDETSADDPQEAAPKEEKKEVKKEVKKEEEEKPKKEDAKKEDDEKEEKKEESEETGEK